MLRTITGIGLSLLISLIPFAANAYFCLPGYHYSENYSFEATCDYYRIQDLFRNKTYNTSCYKGLIFYYYCQKDGNITTDAKK
ncbi:hypothetical protein Lbir_0636 [Legionella birminghamensis]|uniref:Uncharacterized protein n=1 Tax=Legionella birminghamensis TaxID=28083 RepID=A0A378I955_9GAMM|nr:hypothetical protein [Legionella birminghamensis]KTC74846.1 hypothetical protein Lbir_0636 [Legionella birminghamensis]STX31747.1 Uncharacterised protein [Legionella birminghamensis]